ncbi:MAG: TetR/AcrR family transcriptional regulator [Bifidobacteriaceae bacterium]|nr:TetR/AcrR family transcriptional regulator [Bifidobacteriaceae bacterium]
MKHADRASSTRARITEAAARLHEANPGDEFHAVTISDVCREADIARPTFYRYFDSVDALTAAGAAEQILTRLDARAGDAAGRLLDTLQNDEILRQAIMHGGVETRRAAVDSLTEKLVEDYGIAPDDPAAVLRARYAAAGVIEVFLTWFSPDTHPGIDGDQAADLATTATRAVLGRDKTSRRK